MASINAFPNSLSSSFLARNPISHVYSELAVAPRETLPAPALVVIDTISTGTPIHTGGGRAAIVIRFTVATRESNRTGTSVGVNIVLASGT